jgi:hypothetical protein
MGANEMIVHIKYIYIIPFKKRYSQKPQSIPFKKGIAKYTF